MVLGEHDLSDASDSSNVQAITAASHYPHEQYNPENINNDIMLIKLEVLGNTAFNVDVLLYVAANYDSRPSGVSQCCFVLRVLKYFYRSFVTAIFVKNGAVAKQKQHTSTVLLVLAANCVW